MFCILLVTLSILVAEKMFIFFIVISCSNQRLKPLVKLSISVYNSLDISRVMLFRAVSKILMYIFIAESFFCINF